MSERATRHARTPWPDRDRLIRLAHEAQRGEARAVDALLVELRPSFAAFFSRRLTWDVADDLTQAALIRIARAVGQMHPERLGHYMTTSARILLQEEGARRELELDRTAPAALGVGVPSSVDPHQQLEYAELLHAVHRASDTALPPELRNVVLGRLRDLSISEIATELGIEPFVIRLQLLRAQAILRRELLPYVGHQGAQ